MLRAVPEPKDFQRFVEGLWASIAGGEVVVFCGAGISRNSGLPLVPDFVKTVLARLGTSETDAKAILDSPLPFEAFMENLRNYSDISELLAIFEIGAPNAAHLFLAELARAGFVRTFCSTNFDALIEQALEQAGLKRDHDFEVLYRDEDLGRVRTDDRKICVVKLHGSIDDKEQMAITMNQVASKTLSANRKRAIEAVFAAGPQRRVLVLGYSCSDLFDLSPQIEAIALGQREVVLIDHHKDRAEVRAIADRAEKNPFRNFSEGRWVLCDTDELLATLQGLGKLTPPARRIVKNGGRWEDRIDAWARAADAERPGMAAHTIVGEVFFKLSDYERALRYYRRALEVAQAVGDRQREGIYLGNVANSERNLGHVAEATQHYEDAIHIARELGDESREGMWLCNLGGVLAAAGDHSKAIDLLQRALEISRGRHDLVGESYCLGNIGHSLYLTSQYEQANHHYERAIAIARDRGDKNAEATLLGSIGDTLHRRGEYRQALACHEQALTLARQVGDRDSECRWRGKIANDCSAIGDSVRAIKELERGIELARSIGSRGVESSLLSDLGNVYQESREIDKAVELHERSLRIAREIGDRGGEGTELGNIGNARHSQGRFAEALDCFEKALASAVSVGDRQLEGTWLGNLGATYYVLGDDARAIEFQQRSLDLAAQIGDRRRMADAHFNLGSATLRSGDRVAAGKHFRQAVDIYTSLFGADHERTRLARSRLDEVEPATRETLHWIQYRNGNVFELLLGSGKRVVLALTSADMALHVRDLIVARFPGDFVVAMAEGLPRELFEKNAMAEGARVEDYLFVYEGSDVFPRVLAGLEAYEPPAK
jgi:tetratricopeptide (TPR) repeat protein